MWFFLGVLGLSLALFGGTLALRRRLLPRTLAWMSLDYVLGIICIHLAFDLVALVELQLAIRARPEFTLELWGDYRTAVQLWTVLAVVLAGLLVSLRRGCRLLFPLFPL